MLANVLADVDVVSVSVSDSSVAIAVAVGVAVAVAVAVALVHRMVILLDSVSASRYVCRPSIRTIHCNASLDCPAVDQLLILPLTRSFFIR